jgi:exodeoxyribonuclease VII small subunit
MAAKELTIEQTFDKLEDTIAQLQQEDVSLEDSFKLYKEGMKLIKSCNDKIDRVEKQVLKLNENGELDEF